MSRPSQDPDVIRAMDVIFSWNVRVGVNEGHGLYYKRPSPNHIESMAKEMLDALRVDYDRRG